jgi:hypothetical protein
MSRLLSTAALSLLSGGLFFCSFVHAQPAAGDALQVVLIRHGEKPKKGDNLDCQGLNRALALPAMLFARFGIPSAIYIPAPGPGDSTKHARMFETIIPFAVKYNLALDSKFAEKDSAGIAADILQRKGVVLVVWEHKAIAPIAHALGVRDGALKWGDEDYDSIWVVGFRDGVARLERSAEGLKPAEGCPF